MKKDGECVVCGSTDNLEVHHITPSCFGGNHDDDNLKLLCHECHLKIPKKLRYVESKYKVLNVALEDKEYKELAKKKGKQTWHDFILALNGVKP